ncbi:ATP-grasp domain-containing protein [bacterium]|jgi:carbamoyl-phosphate synthase large subunit|nr:ATP-grasp domain-containing protein [bacterium]
MSVIAITGTGSLFGQAIIKSIKNSSFSKYKLIGMDYFSDTIGSYWVDCNYILPDIFDKSITDEFWLESIISIIMESGAKILFVGVDFELHLFAKHKDTIENLTECIIVVSSKETIDIADDKYLTYKFLKDNNLFFPETFLKSEIDDAIKENKISFPVIVKPRNGYRSVDVYIVDNASDLHKKIQVIKNPIIQECIGNDQTEYTCGVIAFNKSIKKSIILRRDLKDGNTSKTYLENDFPEIIKEYIETVSAKLDQFGVCNFQLRIDNNGTPKIFEINARHSGTTYIRAIYGFNEVEYILEYLFNNKEMEFELREGIVQRYFDEFFIKYNK